jgi:hypothetical protein
MKLALAALLAACGPTSRATPDGAGPGPGSGTTGDAGECHDVIDVVFVLDTSSSMDFVLNQLDTGIEQVVTASNALAPDSHFGLIVFQDNDVLDTTGPLEAGAVHTAAATLQTRFRYYKNNFTATNRNPGDGISGLTDQNPICEENSLDALYDAASKFPWRQNATRIVILVTDDTFLERPDNYGDRDGDGLENKTDFPREGNYPAAHTVAETVALLRQNKTRVFTFTRLTPPDIFSRCGTGRRLPWTAITDGWTTSYGSNAPIPMQTGGMNFDLAKIQDGSLQLSETINQVVLDSYCNPVIL